MKASIAMFLEAMRFLQERRLAHRPIRWLINTEEEVGSPVSRPLIEDEARRCAVVFCLEPPAPGGALKTARKGVGIFTVRITGCAAHAGADPERGVSAIQELANQIAYLHSLRDPTRGTTVNVGVVDGGTRSNVIAAEAWATGRPPRGDVRRSRAGDRGYPRNAPLAAGCDRASVRRDESPADGADTGGRSGVRAGTRDRTRTGAGDR
jgi:metal-dependent amidase/aminoacylase/carboxypeptidase family protein